MEQANEEEEEPIIRRHSVLMASLVNVDTRMSPLAMSTHDYHSDDDDITDDVMLSVTNIRPITSASSEEMMRKAAETETTALTTTTTATDHGQAPDDLIKKLYEWKDDKKEGSLPGSPETKRKHSPESKKKVKHSEKTIHSPPGQRRMEKEEDVSAADPKYKPLREKVLRLKEYLQRDEQRLRDESSWGKQAVQQITQLKDVWKNLQKQLEGGDSTALEKETLTFKEKLEEKNKELYEMTERYQEALAHLESTKESLYVSRQRVRELENQLSTADKTYKQIVEELQQNNTHLTELETELRTAKRYVSQAELVNEELSKKINYLNEDAENLTVINDTLEVRLEFERTSISQSEQVYKGAIEELEQKKDFIISIEADLECTKTSYSEIETKNEAQLSELEQLRKDVKSMSITNDNLEKTLYSQQSTLAGERINSAQLSDDLTLVELKMEALKQEQSMLLKNLNMEKKTTEKLKNELCRQQQTMQTINEEISAAQQAMNSDTKEISELTEKVNLLKKENAKLIAECDEIRTQIGEKDRIIEELNECAELKLETMRKVVMLQQSRAEDDYRDYEIELEKIRQEIDALNQQLAQKENQLASNAKTLQEFQEISMYSFYKSAAIE